MTEEIPIIVEESDFETETKIRLSVVQKKLAELEKEHGHVCSPLFFRVKDYTGKLIKLWTDHGYVCPVCGEVSSWG